MKKTNYKFSSVLVIITLIIISAIIFSFGCAKKEEPKEITIGATFPEG